MAKHNQKEAEPVYRKKKAIKKDVTQILKKDPTQGLNHKQLAARLGLQTKKEKDKLLKVLEELYMDGYLAEEKPGKYRHLSEDQEIEGTLDMSGKGFGFLKIEGEAEDIFIPPNKTGTALHGDTVKAQIVKGKRRNNQPEGEVLEVRERKKTEFVGTVDVSKQFAFIIPDSPRMDVDIFIPLKHLNGAKNGQKVVAEFIEWPAEAKSPFGRVKQILGEAGDHDTEMNSIIAEFQLPRASPKEVIKEAQAIPETIPEEEAKRRKDYRSVTTFTIDPKQAKDFDDALSIRKLENGNWEIGIHIADVTYYVTEGSALDEEAFNRATSVYLVDRVIPMLPEKLSNQLCSLRPNEDKLAFSAVFEIGERGDVHNQWTGRTIINSDKRFYYEEAQEQIESGTGAFADSLTKLNDIAGILRKRRFEDGAISFETEEVEFELDENSFPVDVVKKVRQDAHLLIEEFMLLANRKVAEFIFSQSESFQKTPFVYRVHEAPPSEKLEQFVKIARSFGYQFDSTDPEKTSASFNQLLDSVEGQPEQNMLESLAIRTMSKAFYTTKQGGHYGLSFDYYTHFTSPIRRYPDMIAHRLLQHYLDNNKDAPDQEYIEKQCKHSSEMEIRAEEAERASIKYKQVEYMAERIGEEYRGLVAGVSSKALFVELPENKCEGRVPLQTLIDDYYEFDDQRYLVRGTNTGRTYQLGDEVEIRVMEANPLDRKLVFEII